MMTRKELAIVYAMGFVGTYYKYGGNTPIDGWDCSGFIQEVLAAIGIDPPGDQSASALHQMLSAKYYTERVYNPPLNEDDKIRILFFGTGSVSHVALEVSPGFMIEAAPGGPAVTDRASAEATGSFVRIRPISRRSDLVAVVVV